MSERIRHLYVDEHFNDHLILGDILTNRLDKIDAENEQSEGGVSPSWPELEHERSRIIHMLVSLGWSADAFARIDANDGTPDRE